jgi:hypothetical protein
LFAADGIALGSTISLDSPVQVADVPRLAGSPNDTTFVAIWTIGPRRSDGIGLKGQLFLGSGEPVGPPFTVVETEETTDVSYPAVTYLDDNHFAVAWMREFPLVPDEPLRPTEIEARRFEIGFLAPTCGDANGSGFYEATDALVVLRSALALALCDACLCDLDSSGSVTATDALAMLKTAVGQTPTLACPPCAADPATPSASSVGDLSCLGVTCN